MTNFEFVDDVPHHARCGPRPDQIIIDFAEALRGRPKQWAKYPKPQTSSTARTAATAINHQSDRCPAALRTGEFEAVSRDGVCYVRFVGVSV